MFGKYCPPLTPVFRGEKGVTLVKWKPRKPLVHNAQRFFPWKGENGSMRVRLPSLQIFVNGSTVSDMSPPAHGHAVLLSFLLLSHWGRWTPIFPRSFGSGDRACGWLSAWRKDAVSWALLQFVQLFGHTASPQISKIGLWNSYGEVTNSVLLHSFFSVNLERFYFATIPMRQRLFFDISIKYRWTVESASTCCYFSPANNSASTKPSYE